MTALSNNKLDEAGLVKRMALMATEETPNGVRSFLQADVTALVARVRAAEGQLALFNSTLDEAGAPEYGSLLETGEPSDFTPDARVTALGIQRDFSGRKLVAAEARLTWALASVDSLKHFITRMEEGPHAVTVISQERHDLTHENVGCETCRLIRELREFVK